MEDFKKSLPMKRDGSPDEIGKFVSLIVENEIKYINGVTKNFDGDLSPNIF